MTANTQCETSRLEQKHANLKKKIEIRAWLIDALGCPSVLDCFAGAGDVWSAIYKPLPYVGIEEKPMPYRLDRNVIYSDSRRILRNVQFDLSRFSLFDLDAYCSCFEHLWILCDRLRNIQTQKPLIGIALTQSLIFKRHNNIPPQVLHLAECSKHIGGKFRVEHIQNVYEQAATKCFEHSRYRVKERMSFDCGGSMGMVYYGYLLESTEIQ
jgi:hypothetical protein